MRSSFCSCGSNVVAWSNTQCLNGVVVCAPRNEYPTLDVVGEDLVTVLDFLHVKYVVLLGDGAGANVLARFGLKHSSRVLGMILINCTGSSASVMESFKNKVRQSTVTPWPAPLVFLLMFWRARASHAPNRALSHVAPQNRQILFPLADS